MLVTTTFPITVFTGANPSYLDPLMGQTVDIRLEWDGTLSSNHGDGSDPVGCKTSAVYGPSTRTASGATADTVQAQILDPLEDWDVRLQLCDEGTGRSTVTVEAVINRLNLTFGCFGLPPNALARDGGGFPEIVSFTATMCSATILDVCDNRVIGNDNFSITIATGPDHLP
jgi:hypothetical protein